MVARKRKQGQKRRLKKYIAIQTDNGKYTDLEEKEVVLLQKMSVIENKIQEMEAHKSEDDQECTEDGDKHKLLEQRNKNTDHLVEMKKQLQETIDINRRIHAQLIRRTDSRN